MHISAEGKIGLTLALIALAGGGAIMVWPDHTWIGWALMAFSALGLVALGVQHFGERWAAGIRLATFLGIVGIAILGLWSAYYWPTGVKQIAEVPKKSPEVVIKEIPKSAQAPKSKSRPRPHLGATLPTPSTVSPQVKTDDAEDEELDQISRIQEHNRRIKLLDRFRDFYMAGHDDISPEMKAGLAYPPESWLNQQLERRGETWRVRNISGLEFETYNVPPP